MGALLWECEHCETLVRFRSEELMLDADEEGRVECPLLSRDDQARPLSPPSLGNSLHNFLRVFRRERT